MMQGIRLSFTGQRIIRRGGDKELERLDPTEADDTLLILEITKRAPGMCQEDHRDIFLALRMEYGEDALAAIQQGAVRFELQSTRDMQAPKPPETEQ